MEAKAVTKLWAVFVPRTRLPSFKVSLYSTSTCYTIMDIPDPFLIVRRFPYEEPFHTQLKFAASNGMFSGCTDIYCNVDDISNIGKALQNFPRTAEDEYRYEYGSSDPSKKFYRYFLLRAYTLDRTGRYALQFAMNLNQDEPEEGVCKFSFPVEMSAVNRLGKLFERFSLLLHLELRWTPSDGKVYEQYQEGEAHDQKTGKSL